MGSPLRGAELYERAKRDFRVYAELCLSVLDRKTGIRIPYRFNSAQRRIGEIAARFKSILKAKKMGVSTRQIAKAIWKCGFQQNQHHVFICQNSEEVKKQLEERVKPILQSSLIPFGAREQAEHIYFPGTKSRFYIGSAGAKKFGRGSDITSYHLSEFAWWEKPDIITGIEEGLLDNAEGDIETTANGQNHYFQHWKKSVIGGNRYTAVFLPWFLDDNYRIPGAKLTMPDEEEKRLQEAFGLTHEQLAWRRQKIKDMSCPELFPQEYPDRWENAFVSSGRMVFDWVSLIQHEQRCVEPNWRGFLRDSGDRIELVPSDNGGLEVWENPEPRHVYIIGADVSEGLASEGSAFSTAFVMDAGTSRQVAAWHGKVDPDQFADVLVKIGLFYNTALLIPESYPGPGAVTTAKLLQIGYRNIWQRPTKGGRSAEQSYGWMTTEQSKQTMILSLAGEGVRDFGLVIKDKGLVDEMRSFVYNEAGRMEPNHGCFSDRVIAAAIAWEVSREIAGGVHYAKPKLKQIERAILGGGRSAPSWTGPRYGVKPS